MKQSTLYNIIEDAYLGEWKENFKIAEGCVLFKTVMQHGQDLSEGLPDAKKEIFERYSKSLENFYDSMLYCLAVETLHTGIKIGMEIEKTNYTD
ncbi:MAG: hypothetical protein K2O81_01385 [Clostridia bacterium]|nr:hypothetical protein [Clostridia bacterium]